MANVKLRGVNLGYFGMDYEVLVFPHPEYALHPGHREGKKVWYQCPAISYIIEHPDGLVLWETGVSAKVTEEWPPEWQGLVDLSGITPEVCLEARLKEHGLGPDDFRYVVQGHLHSDHAGGLRLFQEAGATVVVHEDEYRYAASLQGPENFFLPADIAFLDGKKPTLISGDEELMRGLRLVSLPGHTPGTMGMLLRLEHTGWALLTSDALYTHDSFGPPAIGSPVVDMDRERWAGSAEKIRRLAHEHEAFLFPGHDETGVKVHKEHSEFRKIDFTPGYVYE